ncbi:MAG: hydroxymethylbilane synthase, partial [Planctomycetota bacterium]
MSRPLVIATRGSTLAMWQANHVRDALLKLHPDLQVSLEVFRTKGDEVLHTPLRGVPGKGLFTKEIENALLEGAADLAVHSLKDLPIELTDGLIVAGMLPRADPADVLVAKDDRKLNELPEGAEVLTGSLRRSAQLLHRRGDLKVSPVRGNVETRLKRLEESDASAIVLAAAGLKRLGLLHHATERLDPAEFLPACGQGAIAVEIRCDDGEIRDLIELLDHPDTRLAVAAERAFLRGLGGGCQVPIGAYARTEENGSKLILTGMVANRAGSQLLKRTISTEIIGPDAGDQLGR